MKKLFLVILCIFISLSLISCGGGKGSGGGAAGKIRSDHPRVLLTPERVTELKSDTDNADFVSCKNYVDSLSKSTSNIDNVLMGNASYDPIMKACLTALVLNDSSYISIAKSWVEKVRQIPPEGLSGDNPKDDYLQSNRLYALAIGYDWLYSQWTSDERQSLADQIVSYLEYITTKYTFLSNPNYITGHSKFCNEKAFAAAVALYNEDSRVTKYYNQVYSNWQSGFRPVMETLFADGGHYFAWGYGTGQEYGSVNFERIWHTATGQFLGYSYLEQVPYFYLYGTDPTPADDQKVGSVLNFGDSWADQPRGQEMLCYSAYSANVSLTQGYIDNYFSNRSEICLPRLLMKRNGSGAATPNGLPLAHQFPNCGFVMARDTWSGWPNGDPTILVFKSTPFYTGNHQHYDQNSFTLNYQGRLLIDSGVYDKYGSDHWRKYYTQTVAHNTLVIDNGSAKDQGQKNADPEPNTLSELTGKYRLDGITNFAQADWGCWMQGDASKAYDSSLVTRFIRDILMVYQPAGLSHPVILVVDRVKLPTSQTPKLLWHTSTNCAPSLQGKSAAVYNSKGGHARLDFLAPTGLKLNLVEGAMVNGTAWEYDPNNLATTGYHDFEPGWGRVEVATSAAVTTANFVTLITVDNKTIDTGGELISGTNWLGAKYGNVLFIIGDSNNPPTEIIVNTTDATGVTEVYVAGVNSGSVNISGVSMEIVKFF